MTSSVQASSIGGTSRPSTLAVDHQLGPQPFLGLVKGEIARWTPIIHAIGEISTIGFGLPLDANRPFDANPEFG
jgi:hypothetical protein